MLAALSGETVTKQVYNEQKQNKDIRTFGQKKAGGFSVQWINKIRASPVKKVFITHEKRMKPAITYNEPAIYYINMENE